MHYTSIWRLMSIALINKIFNSRTKKKGLELWAEYLYIIKSSRNKFWATTSRSQCLQLFSIWSALGSLIPSTKFSKFSKWIMIEAFMAAYVICNLRLNRHCVVIRICHKLHLAISPPILQWFSQSQQLWKALEKTFRSIPVTPRSDQYWPRY